MLAAINILAAQATAGTGFFADLKHQFNQSFVVQNRWLSYLNGLKVSLILTVVALAIGIAIGIIVAIVRTSYEQKKKGHRNPGLVIANFICWIYITVIRGTPMMVQLLIWGLVIFASSRNLVGIAILALGFNSGAYVAEIIRGGIMSIDVGQMEAGRSLGMSYGSVMKDIIIPQAIKNILPALGNELITLFKDTSLVTVIGLVDLTKAAMQIQAKTYQGLMPFIGIAITYLVVVLILTKLLDIFERRLRRSDRR